MKISELKKMIKSTMMDESMVDYGHDLDEAKKATDIKDTEDISIEDIADETETTPAEETETTIDVTTDQVNPNVKAVQDALTQAQAAARTLGDDKLTDQIGNTITFFTRSHIVGGNQEDASLEEIELYENTRMKRIAGIIK
jgi:fructose/tagatose bisphosphate aldolase